MENKEMENKSMEPTETDAVTKTAEAVAAEEPVAEKVTETPAPENQEEKFKRLSKIRIDNTAEDLRKLANLSNRSNYSYTDEDVEKMFAYIRAAVDKAEKAFKQEEFMEEFSW